MFGLTRKSREAGHRQLLEKARNALERLGIVTEKSQDGKERRRWEGEDKIPLEFIHHIRERASHLLEAVYNPEMQELIGDADEMVELAMDLDWIQKYLAGNFTNDERDALRAFQFEDQLDSLNRCIGALSKAVALGEITFATILRAPSEDLIPESKIAYGWFPTQADLSRANELQRRILKRNSPHLSLSDMKEAIETMERLSPRFNALLRPRRPHDRAGTLR